MNCACGKFPLYLIRMPMITSVQLAIYDGSECECMVYAKFRVWGCSRMPSEAFHGIIL